MIIGIEEQLQELQRNREVSQEQIKILTVCYVIYKAFSLIYRYNLCNDSIVFQRIEFEVQCLLLFSSDLSGERCGCD